MLATGQLIKGLIRHLLPLPSPDVPESEGYVRLRRYNELAMQSMVRKSHLLVEEGSYFVCNNAQTGIIEGTATGFVATTPTLIVDNNEDPQNPAAKPFNPDYIDLTVSTAGATGTATQGKALALVIDKGPRYSSGGTELTAGASPGKLVNANMLIGGAPKLNIYFGALTAAAATKQARTIVGQRIYRMPVTATTAPDAVGDRLRIEFGSVEPETTGQIGTTGALMANVFQAAVKVPAVTIPPGYSLLLYTWDLVSGGTYGTGVTWLPELAGWAR